MWDLQRSTFFNLASSLLAAFLRVCFILIISKVDGKNPFRKLLAIISELGIVSMCETENERKQARK